MLNDRLALPASGAPVQNLPVTVQLVSAPSPNQSEPDLEEPRVPFSHYLWILRTHCLKIVVFVGVCMFGTYVASSRLTPIYEATTTVNVDRLAPSGIIGQDAQRSSAANDADQFLSTQIKLIQSDAVLRPVVEKYRLLDHEGQYLAAIPNDATLNAPLVLRQLSVSRPPNTYLLLISYRSTDANLAAEVANGIARSYLEHTYNIRIRASSSLASFMERQLEELRAKMERSNETLIRFEREMNVINPEEKTNILSARLLQLNTEYTTAQSDRVRKEVAFDSAKSGTIEAAMTSTQGDVLKRLIERLNEAEQRFSQIRAQFGPRYPEFQKADAEVKELRQQVDAARQNILKRVELEYREATRREDNLKNAVSEVKAEYNQVNARSFQYQQLRREADADKQLYEELVRKIREAGINAGFEGNSIRLADVARPPVKPVFPNMTLNLTLALLLSTVLAASVAIGADVLDKSIRDPAQVSHMFKAEVLGSLPMVRGKEFRSRLTTLVNPSADSQVNGLVISSHNGRSGTSVGGAANLTLFEESVRTLHSSVLLSDLDQGIRSLLVTSTVPGEGKSTTAVYLAISSAAQGHSTLLIDADMRRPSLHRILGVTPGMGLSNVLSGEISWTDAIVKLENHPNLHVLPAGPASGQAPDLVARGLQSLVDTAIQEYGLVVIDSPPFLNFAEPLRMSTMVDGVLLVAVAGETSRHAVSSVLATLKRVRANIVGLVLNKVTKNLMSNYPYYGSYGKYYKRYYREEHG